ncbi:MULTISPECIES: hypothetical protein [unclassified Sporosarcina]|uniref:hypothetical protein n=1 Tax=unclassified Sporosarcina TaxID=2647733 RepID=UPI002041F887|nr:MULTISPECIES: hypothetical protein [unclassified Sporosarcina]GKV64849.1 hypothetical protein NCCP2331_10020 [Sporosarcina sp. NCCP-2331]GLB54959.1 hypothetical protein NCCP2378_07440 [Sporosarcina sp. NCCP-2378]
MALLSHKTDAQEIELIITGNAMKNFHKVLRKNLKIESMSYSFETELVSRDRQGYVEERQCACTVPDFTLQKVSKVIFYTENIANYINNSFTKIYNRKVFDKIIPVVIAYLLAHETVHVFQVQVGRLTRDIHEGEKKLSYKERPTEIEADNRALEIMKNCDIFTLKICNLVKERKCADSKDVDELMKSFKEE